MIVVLALIIGFAGGALATKMNSADLAGEDTHEAMSDEMQMEVAMHQHDIVEVAPGTPVPTLDFDITKDPVSGYNVHLTTTNFTFVPANASTEHVAGEGHAHIYVDGVKINRVYGDWYHLGTLGAPGEHEVRVELSANDHSTYAVNGEEIGVSKMVAVDK